MTQNWQIEGLDSLFFRGGQPFNAGESGYLLSLFPPSPESLQGLVRAVVLRSRGLPYDALRRAHPADEALRQELGTAKRGELGRLRLGAAYLERNDTVLFPAPAHLVEGQRKPELLRPAGTATLTDLGEVRLPEGSGPVRELAGHWISQEGLAEVLQGRAPRPGTLWRERPLAKLHLHGKTREERPHLLTPEARIGLGRDSERRAAREGHLYAIEMLRPQARQPGTHTIEGVRIGVEVRGLADGAEPRGGKHVIRFGGEGRLAEVEVREGPAPRLPFPDLPPEKPLKFCVVLLSPTVWKETGWHPPSGKRPPGSLWEGVLTSDSGELPVRIVSACLGRAARIGGWELGGGPRDMRRYVPAGSVYFCETDEPDPQVVRACFHHQGVGENQAMGYGACVVGRWPDAVRQGREEGEER